MKMYKTKVELNNALARHINKVSPLLIAELEKGFKQKDSGELFKKDDDNTKTY